jgi:baculoviral IAP repeat-containing protein 6
MIVLKTPLSSAPPSKKPRGSGSGVGYGRGYGGHVNAPKGEANDDQDDENEDMANGIDSTPQTPAVPESMTISQSFHMKVDSKVDALILVALRVISHLLPRPNDEDAEAYDYVPAKGIRPLLLLSTLPETLSELLRNDSITSISDRLKLFEIVITILQDLALAPPDSGITPVLTEPRRVKLTTDGLGGFVQGTGDIVWEREHGRGRGDDVVHADSLYRQLAKLVRHADTFVRITNARSDANGTSLTAAAAGIVPTLLPIDEEAERQAKEALKLAKHIVAVFKAVNETLAENNAMPLLTGVPHAEDGRSRSPAFEQQTCACARVELAVLVVYRMHRRQHVRTPRL